jgi:hypothetical protein
MIMYEPWNEPNNVSWSQWESVTKATLSYWRLTIGYRGVLFLDTPDWSWGFNPTEADAIISFDRNLIGKSNVIFANHRYANANTTFSDGEKAEFQANVGQYFPNYPIAGTEYGNYNNGFANHLTWNAGFFDYLLGQIKSGYNGLFTFTWDWVDPNGMVVAGGNGETAQSLTTLNEWGKTAD